MIKLKIYFLLLAGSNLIVGAVERGLAEFLQERGFGKSASEIMANINTVNSKGDSPLLFVVRELGDNPRTKMGVGALKKAGADLNFVNPITKQAAFIVALRQDHPNFNAAEALIEAGANPNVADEKGVTPLMIAANQDVYWMQPTSNALVFKLLKSGAAKNAKDITGHTAADYAAEKNRAMLGSNSSGRPLPLPPLSLAKVQASKVPVVLKPISKPAPAIDAQELQALLYLAIANGSDDLVEELVAKGISYKESLSPEEFAQNLIKFSSRTSKGTSTDKKVESLNKIVTRLKKH